MDIQKLSQALTQEEAKKNHMYLDTVGKWTIGVGHNLTDKDISDRAVQVILEDDINDVVTILNQKIPWWNNQDDVRQRVLADMCFNMGWGNGLHGLSSFPHMLEFVRTKQYSTAAQHGLDSHWAKQVGSRATKLMKMMETGQDEV